jgi:hypothetical protein
MKTLTAVALCLFICGCSSNSGGSSQVTSAPTTASNPSAVATAQAAQAPSSAIALRDSTVTYSAAQAACAGALGTVTFSLGHARAHPATGVGLQEKPSATSGIVTMTFSNVATGKAALIVVNGHNRSVSGKYVVVKVNKSVACIYPD